MTLRSPHHVADIEQRWRTGPYPMVDDRTSRWTDMFLPSSPPAALHQRLCQAWLIQRVEFLCMEEVGVFWNLGINLEQTERHTSLDEEYLAFGFSILGHHEKKSTEGNGDSKECALRGDAVHHHVTHRQTLTTSILAWFRGRYRLSHVELESSFEAEERECRS